MEFYIRPICVGDGKGINLLRRLPGVFENTLGIPSERIKRNEDYILSLDHNVHQFVAVHEDSSGGELIIGTAGLNIYPNSRLRHSASIGIMVHSDYQKMGVGTKLLETLIDIADNWLMLVRVELTVMVDNDGAIELYKRLGFEEEGIKRKAAIRNGVFVDEMMMSRIR